MAIKVNSYLTSTSANTASETTKLVDTSANEAFEDVLVLNQTALKAMTIDAMVASSATGSVHPDSVDAAAIMAFRNKLPDNIKAPIPTEKWDGGSPVVVEPKDKKEDPKVEKPKDDTPTEPPTAPKVDPTYNEGVLKCSDELNAYFKEAADKYGIDMKLLKCIAYAESNFRPDATSKSGAMGIMQMMPATAKECGVSDPYDARQSIMGGAKYISEMIKKFDGDISLGLAAYNAGANNVKKYGGIPPFEQTQNYVKKILNVYNS